MTVWKIWKMESRSGQPVDKIFKLELGDERRVTVEVPNKTPESINDSWLNLRNLQTRLGRKCCNRRPPPNINEDDRIIEELQKTFIDGDNDNPMVGELHGDCC